MPAADWVVITGASSGIGRALATLMARDYPVLAIARREQPLIELESTSENIRACQADVASEEGREAIVQAIEGAKVRYLVHNAGVLSPIGPLMAQSAADIREALAINVEAPIAITRALLGQMAVGGRILHISSGAAHNAYPGWGAYCMSKAALFMAYEILRQELDEQMVAIGSLRPGVVDTPMQALIREQSAADFPAVEQFRALKADDALSSAQDVARFIRAVLERTSRADFSADEWDIRAHWSRVLGDSA